MTVTGWRYRLLGVGGTLALTVLAVVVASHPAVLKTVGLVPVLGGLPRHPVGGQELVFEAATTAVVVLAAMVALFEPRPWRLFDVAGETARRVVVAVIALAAIGYFDYTYRLPRVTLLVAGGILVASLPIWFVVIRRRPAADDGRTVVVGDDHEAMCEILEASARPVLGYVSPPAVDRRDTHLSDGAPFADGGVVTRDRPLADYGCVGGLSRFDRVLVDNDVDTAVLAFSRPGREEFFGALGTCHDHGVRAKVHRKHADSVLTNGFDAGDLVEVDLAPWDAQDRAFKRLFDVGVAALGLALLAPAMAGIGALIAVTDGCPVLVGRERSAVFGGTVTVYTFRSPGGAVRLGRLLRATNLHALPALWSVLVGDLSVVGPRPVRPGLDSERATATGEWRRRWFVRPGLTGLARVECGPAASPEEKLRYDLRYIRRQSFRFDLRIALRRVAQAIQAAWRRVGGPP